MATRRCLDWLHDSNRIRTDMWYPQLVGYRRSPILTYNFWKYIDVDRSLNPELVARR